MSTLEKTITLLQEMPEQSIEIVYRFIRFMQSEQDSSNSNLKSMEGLRTLQSFAGTLPKDFDYKRELEEAREEKYGHFN